MSRAYYITPIQLLAKQSSLPWRVATAADIADPNIRKANASRALLYAIPPSGTAILMPNLSVKAWTVCAVEAEITIHAAITADNAIITLPNSALDRAFGDFSAQIQAAILSTMSNRRIPSDWILPTTLLREIVGYLLRCLHLTARIGPNYPEADLTARFDTLTLAQRNAITNWMQANNISRTGINAGTAINIVVRRCAEQYNFPPLVLMSEIF